MKSTKIVFGLVLAVLMGISQTTVWSAYTDRTNQDSGDHYYKHNHKGSFTSPFDYGPTGKPQPMPAPAPEAGKCNQFVFDATKSYDVDKQKLSVMWDFGDGTTSDQPVVKKVFEKAGDYNVTLTVKDSSGMVCDTGVATTKVSANYPPVAVAENKEACVGEGVSFDASASSASGPAKYTWDFGDGQMGEGQKVSHTYEKPGMYRVILTVDDQKGTQCSVSSTSVTAKVADRAVVSVSGSESVCVGQTASFATEGQGGNLKYSWDFGDGHTAQGGGRASHNYEKPGNYTVTVTADNGQNMPCSVTSSSTNIKVHGRPIADAGENLVCCVGKSNTFDATKSEGDGLSYHWDFGDGATSDEARATHTYDKNGNYRVVLTVKDSSGSPCGTSTDSFVAVVNAQPEAVIEVR